MKKFLVGYTGFVGSNLNEQIQFDGVFNSKNIQDAYGGEPDILYYAGIPAQKFIADSNPEKDLEIIENAIYNIKNIHPKKLILISTIDIYANPNNVTEEDLVEVNRNAYGKNRYYLEKWVRENIEDYLIVRLPALYGKNLKKNFIYDLIHFIPKLLNESKYGELVQKDKRLENYYKIDNNHFYKCVDLSRDEEQILKEIFDKLGFSALNFTDSRGVYQFYNLKNLSKDIEIALANHIQVLNVATEPIKVSDLYHYLYHKEFKNELDKSIPYYNFKTCHFKAFHGKNGYLLSKEEILKDIAVFVEGQND